VLSVICVLHVPVLLPVYYMYLYCYLCITCTCTVTCVSVLTYRIVILSNEDVYTRETVIRTCDCNFSSKIHIIYKYIKYTTSYNYY